MNIDYPLLLDGGLSNELEKSAHNLNHQLWSASLIESHPEAIIDVHLSYLKAGAQCIITSSYQASIQGFMEAGQNLSESKALILKTVQLAEIAVQQYLASREVNKRPLIAASIGPYGAYLADGSEYRGNYKVSKSKLSDFHQSRIELLDTSKADFFACETIPSFQEAEVLANILLHTKKSAWLSFSCKDELHINDGTPIRECAAMLSEHPNVFAIGVNCTAPKYMSSLIKDIKSSSGSKKVVVYPNSGEVYNAESKSWQSVEDQNLFLVTAEKWLEAGADILGGCCRIGSEHIESLKDRFFS